MTRVKWQTAGELRTQLTERDALIAGLGRQLAELRQQVVERDAAIAELQQRLTDCAGRWLSGSMHIC